MRYFKGTYETWRRKHNQISLKLKYLYLLRRARKNNFLKFFWLLPIYCNVLWQFQLEQPISLFGFSFICNRESFQRLCQAAGEASEVFVSGTFNFKITLIDVLGCAKCDTNLWYLECGLLKRDGILLGKSYFPLYGRSRVFETDEVKNVPLVCKFLVLRGSLFERSPFRSTYNHKGFQFNFLEN